MLLKITEEKLQKTEVLENNIEAIKNVLPSVKEDDIKTTLTVCGGDVNATVATLLESDEGTAVFHIILIIK